MICGLGVDVVEIDRIQEALLRHGERFRYRIYTEREQEYCDQQEFPASRFAVRFAAKEAFAKALGTGFREGLSWLDVSVQNHPSGAPRLLLSPAGEERLHARGAAHAHVSLSHSRSYAVAVVILEAP